MKRRLKFVIFLAVLQLFASQVFSQTEEFATKIIEDNPNACEMNSLYAREMLVEALNTNEKIFIIFRAGDGEGSKTNLRRFTIVRKFLQKVQNWKDSNIFIFARGEKVKGQGARRIFYGKQIVFRSFGKKGENSVYGLLRV